MGMQKAARVRLTRQVDVSPYAILEKGEKGTIVGRGEAHTDVKMDTHHAGLNLWDNEAPIGDEDLTALSPLRFEGIGIKFHHLAMVAIWLLALKGLIGFAVPTTAADLEHGVSWLVQECYPTTSATRSEVFSAPWTSSRRSGQLCHCNT